MKLKAIARLCAKSQAINVIDMPGNIGDTTLQWIGDLTAIYPVFDLPYMEEESIFTIFDVKSAKRDGYFFQCIGVPEGVNLDDNSESEEPIDQSEFDIDIIHSGVTMRPLKTSQGVTFIDVDYLAPLGDYGHVELFERYNPQEEKNIHRRESRDDCKSDYKTLRSHQSGFFKQDVGIFKSVHPRAGV